VICLKNKDVRVRFAPSPTGNLHIGTARTALFNWLFARHHQGKFILRIEDTDPSRSTLEFEKAILADLRWLGLNWDEGPDADSLYGPYRQSQRQEFYQTYAQKLLKTGRAYYCYCLPEELKVERQQAQADGRMPKYSGKCRYLSTKQRSQLEARGRKPAIRFNVQPDKPYLISYKDMIKGEIEISSEVVGDFVIVRSNGVPTYNFAVIIDDLSMKISHVLRGEDHITNTAKQVLLTKALKEKPPAYGHFPMILGKDRSKLSKRHGATSVAEYRDLGYLAPALVNYLALLGWSLDEKTTIMSIDELINHFSLKRVSKSAAIFDLDKLKWLNGVYIRSKSVNQLRVEFEKFWHQAGYQVKKRDTDWLNKLTEICQERVELLAEVVPLTDFFFLPVKYDPKAVDKILKKEGVKKIIETVKTQLAKLNDFSKENIETTLRQLAKKLDEKPKKVFQPIRVAVSGKTVSPPLFETLALLGKETTIRRLDKAKEIVAS
jgi:glutamyl-tRNA synthetase